MITSIFKKSTPINLFLVISLMLVFFLMYHFKDLSWTNSAISIVQKLGILVFFMCSSLITNFVAKKNRLSNDSRYTIFFFFLFFLFFPSLFDNINLIFSNFFILLAIRRLISLQSQKVPKEKIFDASLWIFVATLFNFWSILYIILVYISIIFHFAKDYRNWILPLIAFLTVGIISFGFSSAFNYNLFRYINENAIIDCSIDYFTNTYQNIAFSIYMTVSLFFVISIFSSISSKPLMIHSSIKKIISTFFIGILIFVISSNKSNDLLVYTIAPLSIMSTIHIEIKQLQLKQELVLGVLILCSMFAFFSQL